MESQALESQNNIESQNTQNMGPQISESRHMNRPFLFILFILIAVAIGFGYFIFRDKTRPQITGLEVALKTASFLDKTLQPDGSILGGYECDSSTADKCLPVALSAEQPHTGQAIFSYFLLAEASGDQSHREKADRAINYVLDRCDTDVRMCEWNFFPLAQYYKKTDEDKYLTRGMLRPAEIFLAMTNENVILGNVGHKLASLYDATRDTRYRDRLLEIADLELQNKSSNKGHNDYNIQLAWSIYIPAYQVSKDSKYLAAAEEFFDNFNVVENLMKLGQTVSMVKAGDVLLSMAEVSEKGEEYKAQAHTILQEALYQLWDTPQDPKFNGDYGFIIKDTATIKERVDKAGKYTLFNGWLVKLFVLMGNDSFFEEPAAK